jgi:virulence-associated protein VagC
MVTRAVTTIGLININPQIRGPGLNGELFLTVTDAGILVSPLDPRAGTRPVDMTCITRFDRHDRIRLSAEMRRAAKIRKRVEVSREGNSLLIAPATEVCMVCGSHENLISFSKDQFICDNCRIKMLQASR